MTRNAIATPAIAANPPAIGDDKGKAIAAGRMSSPPLSIPIFVCRRLQGLQLSPVGIKAVIQADLRGVDASELVIEAELAASDEGTPGSSREATCVQ